MRRQNYLFPGYPIMQDENFFKLSQDSVILGSFGKLRKGEKLLDIGCGIGVLLMIMLIRSPNASGTGIEITEGAAELACENLKLCGLEERGTILHSDMRSFDKRLYGNFDVCVSNPPYFAPSRGYTSPKDSIAAARNESCGNIADVCLTACNALKWGGRFYLCYPPERMASLFSSLAQNRLEPKVMRLVHPSENHAPCLVLIEARKGGGEGLCVMPPLLIEKNGEKTEEFKRIYMLEETE